MSTGEQVVFGIHRMTDFKTKAPADNPCVLAYGPGPENRTCETCRFLYRKVKAKVYYKCEKRAYSNGPATDHRVRWPACGKYQEVS